MALDDDQRGDAGSTTPPDPSALASELLARHSSLNLHLANEAETRLKLINRLLFDVLGWTTDDVSVEESCSEDGRTTFADYIVRTANSAFVIEAKKVGHAFELPARTRRRMKLAGSIMKGDVGSAIRQARNYCRTKGIQFAVVTNGGQWLIFPAVRTDQVELEDSYAMIFDSLENLLGVEFEDFFGLLSRESVVAGHLELELLGREEDQLEDRRLGAAFPRGSTRGPNPIYPLIQHAIEAAFTDTIVDSDPDLLKKCYVESAERSRFDRKIQMHLRNREGLFAASPKRPLGKRSDRGALPEVLERAQKSARPLAILILGTVGAGKTTFLHHARHVVAKDYFRVRNDELYPQWIELDFRDFAPTANATEFIHERVLAHVESDQLLSDFGRAIRPAYAQKIESLKRGPLRLLDDQPEEQQRRITDMIMREYEDVSPYVRRVISWIAKHKPVFLVADNVDQLPADTQSRIFSDAMAFASETQCNLVMAMRESTYIAHRSDPLFDAFDFDPIQIEAPEIQPVLSKRFFLARNLLKGESGSFRAINGAQFKVDDLSSFIDIVQSSVLGTNVGRRIEVLAEGNVRIALRMTREFLARGYTDPASALRIHKETGKYILPQHEALRSILLGNQPVYSEEYSVIGNPFDSRLSKTNAQLLRLFVLSALVTLGSSSSFRNLEGDEIRERLADIGFSEDYAQKVMADLCRLSFVSGSDFESISLQSNFFPTRLGGYMIRELVGDLTFVENVLMDTFIGDSDRWNSLRHLTDEIRAEREPVPRLELRIQRAREFFEYMIELYTPLYSEAARRRLPAEWLQQPLNDARPNFETHCTTALRSAKRNYPKK